MILLQIFCISYHYLINYITGEIMNKPVNFDVNTLKFLMFFINLYQFKLHTKFRFNIFLCSKVIKQKHFLEKL